MAAMKVASAALAVVLAALWAASAWTGTPGLQPVATDQWLDLARPFDARMVTHFFGPSRPPGGETVTLPANGTLLLHLSRGATLLPDGAQVVMAARSQDGAELGRWPTDLNPVSPHGFIRRLELPPTTAFLAVTVVDKAEGGPTGFLPYTLILEAWPLSDSSSVTVPATVRAEQDRTYAPRAGETKCQMITTPSRRPDYTEGFASLALAGTPTGVTMQRLMSAGGYLRIAPPVGMRPGEVAEVRLLLKRFGDGAFEEVCPTTLLHGGSTQSLEATYSWHDKDSIWRVEYRLPTVLANPTDAKLDFVRERVMEPTLPFLGQGPRWNDGRGLICFNRLVPGQGVPQSANAFAGRMRLNVTLPADGSMALSRQETQAAEEAVLHSASLWVHSCLACRPDNLSVVAVNGKLFVSGGIAALGGPARGVGQERPPFNPDAAAEREFLGFLGGSRVGILTPFTPYRYIEQPATHFERVCKAKLSERETPMFKRMQESLCSDRFDTGDAANIRVTFKQGDTACGNSQNTIGCRADDELTQYNIRDYRFASGPGGATIGRGAVEVDLLEAVLHEMGHWIGLEHIDTGESIMASSLEQARCIDFDTVKSLAEQTYTVKPGKKSTGPQPFVLRRIPPPR